MLRLALLLLSALLAVPAWAEDSALERGRSAFQGERYAEAFELLKPLAANEDAEARFLLGKMYAGGLGVGHNAQTARMFYELAAGQGHVDAMFNLGVMYWNGDGLRRDEREAARWFGKAGSAGDAEAQAMMGWMYLSGRGRSQNARTAALWYGQAERQGWTEAMTGLGLIHEGGLGVEPDPARAAAYYRQAAKADDPVAIFRLSRMHLMGDGVRESGSEAFRLALRAAELGYAPAQYATALSFAYGAGTEKDLEKAAYWYWRDGLSLLEEGNLEGARKDYDELSKLLPGHERTRSLAQAIAEVHTRDLEPTRTGPHPTPR